MKDTIAKLLLSLNNRLILQQILIVIHLLIMECAQLDTIAHRAQQRLLLDQKELTMTL